MQEVSSPAVKFTKNVVKNIGLVNNQPIRIEMEQTEKVASERIMMQPEAEKILPNETRI